MAQKCVDNRKNIGKSKCNKLPGIASCMITTPDDFKLTPVQMATPQALLTALQNAIVAGKAQRIYKWPDFFNFENLSEETQYQQTMLGVKKVRDGQYIFRYSISKSLCTHKAMFTHFATGGRVFIYDMERQLLGTEDSAGNMRGFKINLLNPEKMRFSDGSTAADSPIYVALQDNKELDENGIMLDVGSVVNELEPLTDVKLELVGAPAAGSIKVKVYVECDGTPVSGLVLADFVLLDAVGAVQNIQAVAEADDVYTLTPATVFADGTLTLAAPADLSIKAYEAVAPVDVDIP